MGSVGSCPPHICCDRLTLRVVLLISERLVKKQQMQWTPRGAHLLLQTRTKVLNNELEAVFR